MPRKKLRESLTARIFLMTALMLLCAGAVTFGLIAWATPLTYTAIVNRDLVRQTDGLAARLADVGVNDCGAVLDDFIRSSGADAFLLDAGGAVVDTGSRLALTPQSGVSAKILEQSSGMPDSPELLQGDITAPALTWPADHGENGMVTVTMSGENTLVTEVRFAGQTQPFYLCVIPRIQAENLAVQAFRRMAPWILAALLAFSLTCALMYSRYITRPIVRLTDIAGNMAELDFDWECAEGRADEIGTLGRSLNRLARRLSAALGELETANRALQKEVEKERELDRQRMAFFSAASHELKTPITILKGQLSGMLEGVGVYRDREKYLFRSLQVTGRMEKLIQEMLTISRMETGAAAFRPESLELSALLERQLSLDAELFFQRGQSLTSRLTPGVFVNGDPSLLRLALGNLLSNAALYSPEGSFVSVWCGLLEHRPAFTVENAGAHIGETALPHLFEPFYREETSRNRSTGGSGLGLYLTNMILERHGASCALENTADGVRATVMFPPEPDVLSGSPPLPD